MHNWLLLVAILENSIDSVLAELVCYHDMMNFCSLSTAASEPKLRDDASLREKALLPMVR